MIKIQGTFLKHKIARRLFFLFILAALLPTSILAIISYQETKNNTIQATQNHLRQDAETLGLSIYERLLVADQQLQLHIRQLTTGNKTIPSQLSSGLTQLLQVDRSYKMAIDILSQNTVLTDTLPHLTSQQRTVLATGEPVVIIHAKNKNPHIYLVRATLNNESIFIGSIDNSFLWGKADTFDESSPFCITDDNRQLLFCSDPMLLNELSSNSKLWEIAALGKGKQSFNDKHGYIGFWNLFLEASFHYPQIMILLYADQSVVNEPIEELSKTSLHISLLTIIVIALLSTVQIRKYLDPLESLLKGITRISKNDFSQEIVTYSDDEFADLATSFNTMSTKLAQQFSFLTSLSQVDQLILSSSTLKDVIEQTISITKSAVNAQSVAIGLLSHTNNTTINLYSKDTNHIHGSSIQSHPVNKEQLELFNHNKIIKIFPDDPNHQLFEPYLSYSASHNLEVCHIFVPILKNGAFSALLILKFLTDNLSQETDSQLSQFASRLTIALERAEWEDQLYQKAHHDPLTQLPNRQLLNDRLDQHIKVSTLENTYFSILFIDLDRFKTINDSLGHTAGDDLLKLVSDRLNTAVRSVDTVARLGGDEFVILMAAEKSSQGSSNTASTLAHKILSAISTPFSILNNELTHEIRIAASIGIAVFPSDGGQSDILLKNADSAMYSAKYKGRNNVQFYSEKLNQAAAVTLTMETELHSAIENNELELYYQPKVDCESGTILGAEALIRWNHPTKGLIPPFLFIPIAEENGLIKQIGQWILFEACRQNKEWQDAGFNNIVVSVNLSPKQFHQQNLVELVTTTLNETNLSPRYLDLEIVENIAMEDIQETINTIKKFRDLGVSVSIDDYGTGFSTLHYLKSFPVNVLKIDREFITHLVEDSGDQAIVTSTILLAHKLGLSVVAEGVENREQLEILQEYGCDEIQGYYFSRPVPAVQFVELLKQGRLQPE